MKVKYYHVKLFLVSIGMATHLVHGFHSQTQKLKATLAGMAGG